jgi:hypothetical protein
MVAPGRFVCAAVARRPGWRRFSGIDLGVGIPKWLLPKSGLCGQACALGSDVPATGAKRLSGRYAITGINSFGWRRVRRSSSFTTPRSIPYGNGCGTDTRRNGTQRDQHIAQAPLRLDAANSPLNDPVGTIHKTKARAKAAEAHQGHSVSGVVRHAVQAIRWARKSAVENNS